MKKYWIKDLNENQVIHVPTEEIAKKIYNKFNALGLKWCLGDPYSGNSYWYVFKGVTCYSPSEGQFCDLRHYTQRDYEIITIDQLLDFQANEYPKVMEVSDDGHSWYKRVVFMEKNGTFLAWNAAESIEEAEHGVCAWVWEFAREIQPDPTLELTLDEIADKFGVSVDRLKIKK